MMICEDRDYEESDKYTNIEEQNTYNRPSKEDKENNFDRNIKRKCTIPTKSGVDVQSGGEQKIADFLYDKGIDFDYDETLKFDEFNKKMWARPDFRIRNTNIVIEYWGMKYGSADNPSYDERAERKMALYEQEQMHLIQVFNEQLEYLDEYLTEKLREAGLNF